MTKLDKPVYRETRRTFRDMRPMIVGLEPGDVLSFRLKGCRKKWTLSVASAVQMAIKAEADAEYRRKAMNRAVRRRAPVRRSLI